MYLYGLGDGILLIEQNNVKLYVLLEEHLTKEYIARLAEMD